MDDCVKLDGQERKLLTDIIDIWTAGAIEAKALTTEDPTISSAEELLDLMSGYDGDLAMLNEIRKKLNPAHPTPMTKEEKIAFRKTWDDRYEKGQRFNDG